MSRNIFFFKREGERGRKKCPNKLHRNLYEYRMSRSESKIFQVNTVTTEQERCRERERERMVTT